jgi:hypothetical protein
MVIFSLADADVVLNDGRIFFAFGIGNNTKEWAGPFVAELYSSELAESADGIREITLNYTTTSPYFLSNSNQYKNVRWLRDSYQ